MTQDKPKRKIRPVTESRWKLPAAAAAAIALLIGGVLIGLFVANRRTVEVPSQIAISTDDACATLPQYGQAQQNVPQQQNPPTIAPPVAEDRDEIIEVPSDSEEVTEVRMTATALSELFIASTPAPTSAPYEAEAPAESRSSSAELGASTASDDAYGYAGGDASTLPDTGGGDAGVGGEMPPAAPADGRERTDTAIDVPEGERVVATSVASFEESYRDEDAEEAPVVIDGLADPDTSSDEALTTSGVLANEQQILQPLRAGEIDDNADWDVYQEYRRNYFQQYSPFSVNDKDITDRQIISVVDENGLPVLGACVQVYNGESLIVQNRTFATGLTMFFPNLLDRTRYVDTFRVVVSKNGTAEQAILDRNAIGDTLTVELPIPQQVSPQLDVMFLLDATGSMSDEIQQLQENILAISSQIDALPGNVDVRYGLVAYRDFGDEYVTKTFDFVSSVGEFQRALIVVQAGGGGDYPEALNEGLNEALNTVAWRGENTVKLVFLVADAPPHLDYNNGLDYSVMMFDSLARGIKIHPIASSGLQPEGEYILRQLAQVTMGHFVFLTYEGSTPGTPGDERTDLDVGAPEDEQGVGDYSVGQLDELVLRLITDELASLRGEQ